MELEKVAFNLRHVIEEEVELFAERAYMKGLELACMIPNTVPTTLRGDSSRLRQVLRNLVANAIKFTEQGEVVVRVENLEESGDTALLRVEISDTGIGMPSDMRVDIFDVFSQGDGSTTRRYGGTGLGLAIAKQIVELMGGKIVVESKPAKGSTFWFTVCLEKGPVKEEVAPASQYDLKGLRVLVVDDNATTRNILHHYLISCGMVNGEAENGQQALEMLRSAASGGEPYDLVILDMMMPDMDVTQLSQAIESDPAIPEARLVMLTSVGYCDDAEEALKAGIITYLSKPVRQSRLYDCIAEVMGLSVEACSSVLASSSPEKAKVEFHAHILLAEDNPINKEVGMAMLEGFGCQVDTVVNGLEAVDAVSSKGYDLILMDCQMPQVDGYEATKAIRSKEAVQNEYARNKDSKPAHVPIIALTAHAMKEHRDRCLSAGMDDYLSKPFKQEQLRTLLEQWLPQETVMSGAAEPKQDEPETTVKTSQALLGSEKSPIDAEVLDRIRALQRKGSSNILEKAIHHYVSYTPKLLAALSEASAQGDASALQKAAHSLKSSSANLGAVKLVALCKEIEMKAHANTIEKAQSQVAKMHAEYERVRVALEAKLSGGADARRQETLMGVNKGKY